MNSDAIRQAKDRGAELLGKGKWSAAQEQYERVLKVAPDDLTARQKLAESLVRRGKPQEAIVHFARACDGYARAGKAMQAIALCKVILGIDPRHTETQSKLSELYAKSGRAPSPSGIVSKPVQVETAPLEATAFTVTVANPEPELLADEELIEIIEDTDVVAGEALPEEPNRVENLPLFSSLTPAEFKAVLEEAVDVLSFDAGEAIVSEGAAGDAMYVVVEGRVSVERQIEGKPVQVDEMGAGDVFGEVSLVTKGPRLATVRASEATVTLRFAREPMQAILARFPRMAAVLDQFARDRLMANWLRVSPLFRGMDAIARAGVMQQFDAKPMKAGEVLVHAGRPSDGMYLLLRGECAVTDPNGAAYPDLVEGDSFGEISVASGGPATATVTARRAGIVLRLPADVARARVLDHPAVAPVVQRIIAERLQRTAQLLS